MKYTTLYNTQINNEFKAKGEVIEFPKGTDEGYILSLLRNKVIQEISKDSKNSELETEVLEDSNPSKTLKKNK